MRGGRDRRGNEARGVESNACEVRREKGRVRSDCRDEAQRADERMAARSRWRKWLSGEM